ncbi:MAG: hypothetical protein AN487_21685 [Anabaena sp. CRKS33]|jgi:hypothetical protein|nr:hypothetical protein [Dolichospermum circinale Clear-D4]OBQ32816.1 MAG: hypothetical protein AN487_21685 [Anabaena sp. CRKS33]
MKSKVINLAVASVVSISSLFLSVTVSSVASSANVQTVKQNINKKKFVCKDKTTLDLYKAVDELNTRIGVSINYLEFRKYYIDLILLQKKVTHNNKCSFMQLGLKSSLMYYDIARILWENKIQNGTDFIYPHQPSYAIVLKTLPNIKTVGEEKWIYTETAISGFFTLAVDSFNKIAETTEIKP